MHMADALLSPGMAGTMWGLAGVALALASRRLRAVADDGLVPLMGMLGAFVFAAQMINFSIPGTGSSGHLGGGLLLALLLGPQATLVVVASVLAVQALFFADGGLLALGANLFNMGLLPCCVAYPLVYRPLAGAHPSPRRQAMAIVVAAIVGVLLGATAVVLQTTLSGISSLPLATFGLLMLPIHLAIGIVEGLATAAIVLFLRCAQPDLLARGSGMPARPRGALGSIRPLLLRVGMAAALCAGVLSWFGSTLPDGLSWSVARAAGTEPAASAGGVPARAAALQQRLAWMPGYALPAAAHEPSERGPEAAQADRATTGPAPWPAVKPATSLAGLVGGGVTALIILAVGMLLRRRQRRLA